MSTGSTYLKHPVVSKTILTPAHLLWVHLPHCTHNTELAFTLKLQTPHGSTLLLDMSSSVMPPQTIPLVFSRLTFKPLLSKASLHYKNLFLSPSIVSLIRSKSSAYSNSLSAPSLANSVTKSTTTAKKKGDSTDPWCILTLTSNASDNSEFTLTLGSAPLYRLITDPTKTSDVPILHIAHSNTLLGTSSNAFPDLQKHNITLFP